ncbi:MAG: hypothetical protein AABX50_01075 [Nanoarchaeota archaeon]
MKFWNSLLTEKSWKILQDFGKKYDFILIGGWATYLWAKQQKSKDIDIVVEIKELQKLKAESLSKNDRLKKYEIKIEDIDIDLYVSHYSKLTIPPEDLKKYAKKIEGFKVLSPEALMILKQGAYEDRKNSLKGEKDLVDIMSLIFSSDFDFGNYKSILNKYSLSHYVENLIYLLSNFKDYDSLNLTPRDFKLKKVKLLKDLRKL